MQTVQGAPFSSTAFSRHSQRPRMVSCSSHLTVAPSVRKAPTSPATSQEPSHPELQHVEILRLQAELQSIKQERVTLKEQVSQLQDEKKAAKSQLAEMTVQLERERATKAYYSALVGKLRSERAHTTMAYTTGLLACLMGRSNYDPQCERLAGAVCALMQQQFQAKVHNLEEQVAHLLVKVQA